MARAEKKLSKEDQICRVCDFTSCETCGIAWGIIGVRGKRRIDS